MYDDDYGTGTNKGKRNSVIFIAVLIAVALIVVIIADNRKTTNTANIDENAGFQAIIQTPTVDVNANENENFVRLVYSETLDQSNSLNLAIANVVRNRVNSPDFPNTINGVIWQDAQFPSVYNWTLVDYRDIPLKNIDSVQRCIDASKNYDEVDGAMFYYRLDDKTDEENMWILKNFEHTIIDGYCFLKEYPYK